MNPYVDIEVTPLYSKDGMRSSGKSVRIENEDDSSKWNEIGVVSSNYLLVHNHRVKQLIDIISQMTPYKNWTNRKQFFDGRRFVYSITTDDLIAEIKPGDLVRFGLIGYNSYDGSTALSVGMYSEHVICSNGMTSNQYFSSFVFKHTKGNIDWQQSIEEAFKVLIPDSESKLTTFANQLRILNSKVLSVDDLGLLRENYLNDLPLTTWGKVIDRFLMKEEKTGMGLLDASTNILWHGKKQTYSDFRNNSLITDKLIDYSISLN